MYYVNEQCTTNIFITLDQADNESAAENLKKEYLAQGFENIFVSKVCDDDYDPEDYGWAKPENFDYD